MTETTPENETSLADTLSPYTVDRNDEIAALNVLWILAEPRNCAADKPSTDTAPVMTAGADRSELAAKRNTTTACAYTATSF
jgi:hypothetical protein